MGNQHELSVNFNHTAGQARDLPGRPQDNKTTFVREEKMVNGSSFGRKSCMAHLQPVGQVRRQHKSGLHLVLKQVASTNPAKIHKTRRLLPKIRLVHKGD